MKLEPAVGSLLESIPILLSRVFMILRVTIFTGLCVTVKHVEIHCKFPNLTPTHKQQKDKKGLSLHVDTLLELYLASNAPMTDAEEAPDQLAV